MNFEQWSVHAESVQTPIHPQIPTLQSVLFLFRRHQPAICSLNQENLKSVKVCVPNENTLKQFASFAIPVRKQLINNIEENQQLTELRDWLLPMLMNGQVKVMEDL